MLFKQCFDVSSHNCDQGLMVKSYHAVKTLPSQFFLKTNYLVLSCENFHTCWQAVYKYTGKWNLLCAFQVFHFFTSGTVTGKKFHAATSWKTQRDSCRLTKKRGQTLAAYPSEFPWVISIYAHNGQSLKRTSMHTKIECKKQTRSCLLSTFHPCAHTGAPWDLLIMNINQLARLAISLHLYIWRLLVQASNVPCAQAIWRQTCPTSRGNIFITRSWFRCLWPEVKSINIQVCNQLNYSWKIHIDTWRITNASMKLVLTYSGEYNFYRGNRRQLFIQMKRWNATDKKAAEVPVVTGVVWHYHAANRLQYWVPMHDSTVCTAHHQWLWYIHVKVS